MKRKARGRAAEHGLAPLAIQADPVTAEPGVDARVVVIDAQHEPTGLERHAVDLDTLGAVDEEGLQAVRALPQIESEGQLAARAVEPGVPGALDE